MQLKRLWDINNKKMVFVKWPTWHDCQLWVDEKTEKMYYYDMSQWIEYTQSSEHNGKTYWPTWKTVDWDDEMWVYDTDKPTDLFVWESGDKVSYVFKNYDGTVLKEGKVKEGTAPTPPANPTRPATSQYTYTFAWWNPEVWAITKKTVYTATYNEIPNFCVSFVVSPEGWWNVCDRLLNPISELYVPTWTTVERSIRNRLQFFYNEEEIARVSPEEATHYEFSSWGELPETITENVTMTATFMPVNYTVTIGVSPEWAGTVDTQQVTVAYGTEIDTVGNELIIWSNDITATAESGYEFSSWGTLPETVTEDLTITATFIVTVVDAPNRWPCPSGWHVPTREEWSPLINNYHLWDAIHLSCRWGVLNRTTGEIKNWDIRNQYGMSADAGYLTCEAEPESEWEAFASYYFISWEITTEWDGWYGITYMDTIAPMWLFIRPFKDEPLIPDQSWDWTQELEEYGYELRYNSTLWVYTIKDNNGTNPVYTTIADKNLWATVVYTMWDTTTQANVGNFYQWGNNYGFPYSDATNTRTSQVDASSYWPWNYYSDDDFFIDTEESWWDSSYNANLWGWYDLEPPL